MGTADFVDSKVGMPRLTKLPKYGLSNAWLDPDCAG